MKSRNFNKFMGYYNAKDAPFQAFIPYLNYSHYPKDTYIFRSGEINFRFFIIIKGVISIRAKINRSKILPKVNQNMLIGERKRDKKKSKYNL